MTRRKLDLREREGASLPATHAEPARVPLSASSAENSLAAIDMARLEQAIRLAELLARSSTLPEFMRGKPEECLRVVELAMRTGMPLFGVADEVYGVRGRVGVSGKLAAAILYRSGVLEGALRFEYAGTGKDRRVRVIGRRRGEAFDRVVEVTLQQGLADSQGARERWNRDPDQMLAYYGARAWGRRHAPDALLGVWTDDELRAMGTTGTSTVAIDADVETVAEDGHAERPQPEAAAPQASEATGEALGFMRDGESASCGPAEQTVGQGGKRQPLAVREPDGGLGSSVSTATAWLAAYRARMQVVPLEERAQMAAQNLAMLRDLAERARKRGHESVVEFQRELEAAEALAASAADEEPEQPELLG